MHEKNEKQKKKLTVLTAKGHASSNETSCSYTKEKGDQVLLLAHTHGKGYANFRIKSVKKKAQGK